LLVQLLPDEFMAKVFKSNTDRLEKSISNYSNKDDPVNQDTRSKNLRDIETLTAIIEGQSELHSTK